MNTFFFTMLEDMSTRNDYSFTKCERILKRKRVTLDAYPLLIIPINVTGSHWFLAVYHVEQACLWIVDSLLGVCY
jgi:sentrin-specific protease 1